MNAGSRIGAYEIIAKIGEGGMGEVYRARDTRLDREVAIKVLPATLAADSAALDRFQREAKSVAALSHPNILALYDIGNDRGTAYIVTELLSGDTLRASLTQGPLPLLQTIDLASSIADGLAAAHDKGIVHRDLKPENIFVTADGRVKILDFGLAKAIGGDAVLRDDGATQAPNTQPGIVLGTIGYMSPEQVRGEDADHRADIFSLGTLVYEMLTGRRAFSGPSAADTMSAILKEEPGQWSPVGAPLSSAVQPVVARCLAKRPADRYQSAREVKRDLQAALRVAPDREPALSIAVLPFADMSPAKDQEYFCEGMAEELINGLARIDGLRVAARSSAFQFKGQASDVRRVGEALKVTAVLEGSVRTAGKQLRITAQLNDATNGYQMWSRRYDRELTDVFEIQDAIAADIIDALRLQFGVAQPQAAPLKRYTDNLEAYHLYLQGRYFFFARTKGSLQRAMQYFERAIAMDANYALAYAGLADLHAVFALYGFTPPHQAFAKVEECATRALAIDGHLAEAHFSAMIKSWLYDRDWVAAERAVRRSLELNPNNPVAYNWMGHLLTALGRTDEARRAIGRGQELDPLSAYVNGQAALVLVCQRLHEDALAECRKALDVEPNHVLALYVSGMTYMRLGRHLEAIVALEKVVALTDRASFHDSQLGVALAMAGHLDDARAILAHLESRARSEYVSPLCQAWLLGALGDMDAAFEQLERADDERAGFLCLPAWPAFDGFRRDPRFGDFVRNKLRLPEP
jgi:TolB-like protein/Flp pilus assembly protein TadD